MTAQTTAALDLAFSEIGPTGAVKLQGRDILARREENASWNYCGTAGAEDDAAEIQAEIDQRFSEIA